MYSDYADSKATKLPYDVKERIASTGRKLSEQIMLQRSSRCQ